MFGSDVVAVVALLADLADLADLAYLVDVRRPLGDMG